MKLTKIFAVVLATLSITACSDDDKSYPVNTASGVTVEMGETEITVVENQGLFSVPIVVNGDPNGYITVTVDVVDGEYDDVNETEPAIDDAHYYVTTKTIRIAPDTKVANIEVSTQDNDEENLTRVFYMNIKSVEGATVANDNYTQINIKNKSLFNKLGGKWIATGLDYDGNPIEYECTMVATDPNETTCTLRGIFGYDWMELTFMFDYDRDTGVANLDLVYGATIAAGVSFGDPIGQADLVAVGLSGETSGLLPGVMNEDLTVAAFEENNGVTFGIFKNGSSTGYLFDRITNLKLARVGASAE